MFPLNLIKSKQRGPLQVHAVVALHFSSLKVPLERCRRFRQFLAELSCEATCSSWQNHSSVPEDSQAQLPFPYVPHNCFPDQEVLEGPRSMSSNSVLQDT